MSDEARRFVNTLLKTVELAVSIFAVELVIHVLLLGLEIVDGNVPSWVATYATYGGILVFLGFVGRTVIVHLRELSKDLFANNDAVE